MTTTATRAPQLSAVRVGKGTATHAGHLSTFGTPNAPRYIPLCPAGAPRFSDDNSPAVVAHGAPVADRVTCRTCASRYAHAVGTVHAAQDADRAPLVDVHGYDADGRPAVGTGYVESRERVTVAGRPMDRVRLTGNADGSGDRLDVWEPVAQVEPDPTEAPNAERAPAGVWATLVAAADLGSPAGRLRRAWIDAARRRAYGLPALTRRPGAPDPDVAVARDADTRDADTRARAYLAAYASLLDDRAEPVDRAAERFAAPDDATQVAAGTRPTVGTLVTVEGYPGRWEIMRRSAAEQRRYPHAVRVRQEGHTANAGVALDAVTVCPPDAPESGAGGRFGWQAVQIGAGQDADGVGEWPVYAADGGKYVGEVWRSRGVWTAYRRGHGAGERAVTHGPALAAVGWLDTIPAEALTMPAGVLEALPDGPDGARLVLADGSTVTVESATEEQHGPTAPGAGRSRFVRVTVRALPARVQLDAPRPLGVVRARGVIGPDHAITYQLTYRAGARLALAPPCDECDADAGRPCAPFCPADPC